MSTADTLSLEGYARQAVEGKTDLERRMAASVLLHAALKAVRENEELRASRHLRLVVTEKEETP